MVNTFASIDRNTENEQERGNSHQLVLSPWKRGVIHNEGCIFAPSVPLEVQLWGCTVCQCHIWCGAHWGAGGNCVCQFHGKSHVETALVTSHTMSKVAHTTKVAQHECCLRNDATLCAKISRTERGDYFYDFLESFINM